jgi:hypothetical protein
VEVRFLGPLRYRSSRFVPPLYCLGPTCAVRSIPFRQFMIGDCLSARCRCPKRVAMLRVGMPGRPPNERKLLSEGWRAVGRELDRWVSQRRCRSDQIDLSTLTIDLTCEHADMPTGPNGPLHASHGPVKPPYVAILYSVATRDSCSSRM